MRIRQWLLDEAGRVVRVHESADNGRTWVMLDPEGIFPMPGGIYARHATPSASGCFYETVLEKVPDVGDPPSVIPSRDYSAAFDRPRVTPCVIGGCGRPRTTPGHGYCEHHEAQYGAPIDSTQSTSVLRVPSRVTCAWDGCVLRARDDSDFCFAHQPRRTPILNDQEQLDRLRRLEAMQKMEALIKSGVISQDVLADAFKQVGIDINEFNKAMTKPPKKPGANEPEKETLKRRIRL